MVSAVGILEHRRHVLISKGEARFSDNMIIHDNQCRNVGNKGMTSQNEQLADQNLRYHEDEYPGEAHGGNRLWGEKEKRLRSPRGSSRASVMVEEDKLARCDASEASPRKQIKRE